MKEISDWHIKDETKSDRPMVVTGKAIVSKIRKIIRSNGRYTICNISKAVGISLWISVRWIPHILTRDRSKTGTSSTTNTKLKMFPKYQSNYQHSNLFLLFQTSKKKWKLNTAEGHLVAKKRFLLHILLNMRGHRRQKCYIHVHVSVLPRCFLENV